jgi:flagellar basal-body rod protein FlgG
MPIQALYTAATGMDALQSKLDTIANNLANVNTTAFKRDRTNFEDLFYVYDKLPGTQDADGNLTPVGIFSGLGTKVSSTQTDHRQGNLDPTNRQLDWAIEGEGFFQVTDPGTGVILYTRAGNFDKNTVGQIVLGSADLGRLLEPPISIPPDATEIAVSPQGVVSVKQFGNPQLQQVGTLQLVRFVNPDGLLKLGENLYAESEASGQALIGNPGTDGLGLIRQGALELSNVEPVRELIDLITTQRSFELNSEAIKAGDQMLQLVANLRRF